MGIAEIPWETIFNDYIKGEWRLERTGRHHHNFNYEELADRYGCSAGTIANYARKNSWVKKREIFQASLKGDENFYSQMAASLGGDVISITSEILQNIKDEIYEKKTPSARGRALDPTQKRLNNIRCLEIIQRIVNGIISIETSRIKESDIRVEGNTHLTDSARRKEIERLTKIVQQQQQGL